METKFMGIKLVLVCKEGESRQAYLKEAKASGAEVDIVSNYGELYSTMIANSYSGVMVDLVTSMKISKEERSVAQEIIEVFPVVQLKWENTTNGIHAFSSGQTSNCDSLADFIDTGCKNFPARPLRRTNRKNINFNVTMSKNEVFYDKFLEYTVTINVSQGGCFLFSPRNWKPEENVWFIINELQDKTPIAGNVRWYMAWGKTMRMPGIGVSFKQIEPNQLDELISRYSLV
jgi:Tfp pilus assembly protein PilZ